MAPLLLAQNDIDIGGLTTQDWITAGITFAATIVLAIVARRIVTRITKRFDVDPGPAKLVGRFFAFLVFVAGFIYTLASLDIAIGPVLGAVGVGGLALAFALQDIIENLIAGLILQTQRPFRIGDQVKVGGYDGTVEDISLRTTILKTYDGRRVFVPSSDVLQSGIENNTAFDRRRTTLAVGVGYDTDLETAHSTLLAAVQGVDPVYDEPAPQAWVESFGGSSIDFAVRFWHDSPTGDEWATRHEVAIAVKKALDAAGIEIPFPIRTLDFPGEVGIVLEREGETESA